MIVKIIRKGLCALLLLAILAGCSPDNTNAPAVSGSGEVTTSAVQSSAGTADGTAEGGEHSHDKTPEELQREEEIKQMYTLPEEDSAALTEENTTKEIKYGGFTCKYFPTPALSEDVPLVSVTPMHSHSGLHDYIEKNSALYDLGDGEGSFATTAEQYMDSDFEDTGVLVIAFSDSAGGSDYSLTGAWDDHIHGDGFVLEHLMLAVKRTAGENTAGHLMVEMDTDFINLWDSISIEIYE